MYKLTKTKAKKKAWVAFSRYIRLRDALKTTGSKERLICITCDKQYPAFGKPCAQAGHFIPGRNNSVLINEGFVHGQCYNCNINLKGNWVIYEEKMIKMWGKEAVQIAKRESHKILDRTITEWLELESLYKVKLKELTNSKQSVII